MYLIKNELPKIARFLLITLFAAIPIVVFFFIVTSYKNEVNDYIILFSFVLLTPCYALIFYYFNIGNIRNQAPTVQWELKREIMTVLYNHLTGDEERSTGYFNFTLMNSEKETIRLNKDHAFKFYYELSLNTDYTIKECLESIIEKEFLITTKEITIQISNKEFILKR